ncbi:(fungal and plant) [Cordyceps militaris]|uniref:(Fungal and plant) n=1 Tax=Cordyceps militaris TaxID=73501 RepID=A0A2H4SMB8_CORMI|nr:(fungal and plant) [Cordyceps militaris]
MRLFLVPVSTRRTLLYAQRLRITTKDAAAASLLDKGVAFAARTWAGWEKRDKGWQRKVVDYGNYAFRRIPFAEWGLKSVPPLSARRRAEELQGDGKVELVFPASVIPAAHVESVAQRLATERQAIHRRQMMWCFVGMPITLPFALVPVIPNLPFFYLVYRAFSNWRAIAGGKHVQWLIEKKLLLPSPSKALDLVYAQSPAAKNMDAAAKEEILLTHTQIRTCTDTLDIPELETELERAVWQIEEELKKEEQKKQEAEASSPGKKRDDASTTNDDKKNQ